MKIQEKKIAQVQPTAEEKELRFKQLLDACKALMWPNVPSADDVALLVIATYGTQETREKAMELVENLRRAQAHARAVIKLVDT